MIVIAIILLITGAWTTGLTHGLKSATRSSSELGVSNVAKQVKVYVLKHRRVPDDLDDAYRFERQPQDPGATPMS